MGPYHIDGATETVALSESLIDAIRRGHMDKDRVVLFLYHRDGAERVILSPDTPTVIGRALPAQVRIRDDSLSREHARFTLSRGVITVEDLRSTNGTWVRGARIERGEVRAGEKVVLGSVIVSIRAMAPDEGVLPGLMSHERFQVTLEEEVMRARFFRRSLTLLMLRAARGAEAHVSRWYLRVRALLRPVDRMALYSSDTVAILLVETGADAALEVARAITAARAEGAPPLFAGVAPFPDAATEAEQLLEVCWCATRNATPERPVQSAPLGALSWSGAQRLCEAGDEPIIVSQVMRRVFETVARLSQSSIPVLLQGETGTGKEVLARAIHEQGPRRGRQMVCVNCGAIPQQLLESTLFGHERGAFTGATQQQKGVFEAADGGVVFLDEIGELPLAAQAALLRVLETRRITRVGSNKEIVVDVRVIAATHRDLEAMCASGTFRLDLLYRLNAMTLTIPPLRERPEEIEPLALRFLQQANKTNGRAIRSIEPAALALLQAYAWPGNVRELRNAVERAVVIAEGERIGEQDLPERVCAASRAEAPAEQGPARVIGEPGPSALVGTDSLKARLQRHETELILAALRDARWNQTEAARALGMPLRTLVHKLKALGIKKLGYAPSEEPPPERQESEEQ